jgi:hypothetical protein
VSRELLAHNREESVFVYPVVLLYQGVSPHRSNRGRPEGLGSIVSGLSSAGYCQR